MPTNSLTRQFASFAAVGILGFAIDASIFLLLTQWYCNWRIPWARAVSALCSTTVTWALNRGITFADQNSSDKKSEYARYLIAQILGLSVNLGVFSACLALIPSLREYPIVALVAGAAAALLVNFLTARNISFRRDLCAQDRQLNCRGGNGRTG